MNKRITAVAAVFAATFSLAAAASDPVTASFERMFEHRPAALPAAAAGDVDPLRREVNGLVRAALAVDIASAAAVPGAPEADPALASFGRMLAHAPAPLPRTVPAGFADDPLQRVVAEPLRDLASGHVMPQRFAALKVAARR
jgi:hypothetical protein